MKYLLLVLVGLLLGTTDLPAPHRDALSPLLPFFPASASFAFTAGGITTEVGIDVEDPAAPTQVSIFITGHKQGCPDDACSLDLAATQAVTPLVATIDRWRQEG